uniref:F-box domain-containing protein n=1 Tax=Mycena chlorophos TaxID=658473 RepID=A0ABQ0L609_MYCCL|nr:predicted protein [Mycena chlorophos]
MLFLDIPPELLIRILLHAEAESIRICTQVCNSLRILVQGPVALRYIMALNAAGVVENLAFSHAPTSERLTALELRESARARMEVSWKQSFSFSFIANMNELSDGFYCAGEAYEMEAYLLPLPIRQNTRPKWESLELISTEEAVLSHRIIDINISVKDDLLVAAKYTPSAGHGGGEVSLYPYCFSTSSLHPLATGAIKVMDVPPPCLPYVALDVAGDLVVYVVLLHGFDPSYGWPLADDRVFVYNWKTGDLKKEISAPPRSYLGRVFLTLDTIVLVNMLSPALEIWDLTSSDSTPSLVLQLPPLQTDFIITEAAARCSHNPHPTTPSSGSLRHDLAFAPDPDAAIIYFTFSIESPQPEDKRCLIRLAGISRFSSARFLVAMAGIMTGWQWTSFAFWVFWRVDREDLWTFFILVMPFRNLEYTPSALDATRAGPGTARAAQTMRRRLWVVRWMLWRKGRIAGRLRSFWESVHDSGFVASQCRGSFRQHDPPPTTPRGMYKQFSVRLNLMASSSGTDNDYGGPIRSYPSDSNWAGTKCGKATSRVNASRFQVVVARGPYLHERRRRRRRKNAKAMPTQQCRQSRRRCAS